MQEDTALKEAGAYVPAIRIEGPYWSCDKILNDTWEVCLAPAATGHCIFLWPPEHYIFSTK